MGTVRRTNGRVKRNGGANAADREHEAARERDQERYARYRKRMAVPGALDPMHESGLEVRPKVQRDTAARVHADLMKIGDELVDILERLHTLYHDRLRALGFEMDFDDPKSLGTLAMLYEASTYAVANVHCLHDEMDTVDAWFGSLAEQRGLSL